MFAAPPKGSSRIRPLTLLAAGGLALVTAAAVSVPAQAAPTAGSSSTYIVQLLDPPAAGYRGGLPGLRATKPVAGAKLAASAPSVRAYRSYLDQRQEQLARRVGTKRIYSYTHAYNGFAAKLTTVQAAKLRGSAGVVAVTKDARRYPDTSRTPQFLGLTGPDGLWAKLGGTSSAGKGVVVGVVDTGLWPESPSFSDLPGKPAPPRGWAGVCQPGERWSVSTCNSKVIGARYFVAGFGADNLAEEEFLSARDGAGHGSHTASTAAGNNGVPASVEGRSFGAISGMAPAALIAVYKALWTGKDGANSGTSVDLVAAIDAAVADGVDVINYSISGSQASYLDPADVAFLFAADAGIFVATSAGNNGPGASTVAHNGPWMTTVAAGTHDRDGQGTVRLGDGRTFEGKSVTAGTPMLPLVNSTAAAKRGADPTDVRLCVPGTLDPAKVRGKIVTCERGVIGRTDKSLAVKEAGGRGMILYNPTENSLNADVHFLPTVHVDEVAGAAIVAYAARPGATVALASRLVFGVKASTVAEFSSRGPATAGADLLKPDVLAPGVDVLAAVAPPSNHGRAFDFLSGTSMSAPHVAGIGALYRQGHRTWSPMMIKSAIMTGAVEEDNTGARIAGSPFDYGAGHISPTRSLNPGLTYDSGFADWVGFLCGTGELVIPACASVGIDPSDYNSPSIMIGQLAGRQTVTRSVTNVSGHPLTFRSVVRPPTGVRVEVSPSTLTLAAGQSESFTVTFTRTTAPLDEFASGRLFWTTPGIGGRLAFKVRSPLVVRPVAAAVAGEVVGSGASGSATTKLDAGYTGPLGTDVDGLFAAKESTGVVLTGADGSPFDLAHPTAGPHTAKYTVNVPASAYLAGFALFAGAYPEGTDLDLFVYKNGVLVGLSAGGTADERVDLDDPAPGAYDVYVDAFDTVEDSVTPRLFTWALSDGDVGNLDVTAPASVRLGESYDVTVEWSGLAAGARYLGVVNFQSGGERIGRTFVRVDT